MVCSKNGILSSSHRRSVSSLLLLSLLISGPLSSLSAQDSAPSSFDAQLQEAVKPLLSLPAEQRKQLAKILRLYEAELTDLRNESKDLTEQVKSFRLEISGLKIDLTMTSEQLAELSKLLNEERTKHQDEVAAVRREWEDVQIGTVVIAVVAVVFAYFLGGLR